MSMRGCALAFLLVCGAPIVAQGTTTPRLVEALPEDKCGDPEVRELIAEGHDFRCYVVDDTLEGDRFCTISGKCVLRVAVRAEATSTKDLVLQAVAREGQNFSALTTKVRQLFVEKKEATYVSLVRPFGRASDERRTSPVEADTIATTTDYRSLKKVCEGPVSKVILSIIPVVRSTFCAPPVAQEGITPLTGNGEDFARAATLVRRKVVTSEAPPPHVALIAEPAQVPLSGRSTLLWRAENVKPFSCRIEGPGLTKEKLPVEGSISTPAIIDHSTYMIACESEGGGKAVSRTSIDIGL